MKNKTVAYLSNKNASIDFGAADVVFAIYDVGSAYLVDLLDGKIVF